MLKSVYEKIILIFAILLIIGGGFYFYTNNKNQSEDTLLNTQKQSENNEKEDEIIEKCNSEKDKEKCLSSEAISSKEMAVCNLIPEAKNYCFSSYGIEFNDIKACEQVEKRQNSQSKELCYQYAAFGLEDESICYNLPPDGRHYRECFGKMAFIKKDKQLCKETGDYKEYCERSVDTGTEWFDYRN